MSARNANQRGHAPFGVAVVIYGVLVLALHCIRRSDLELLPKGDKLARLLHIS